MLAIESGLPPEECEEFIEYLEFLPDCRKKAASCSDILERPGTGGKGPCGGRDGGGLRDAEVGDGVEMGLEMGLEPSLVWSK